MGNLSINVGPKGRNMRLINSGRHGNHGYRDGSREDFRRFKLDMLPGLGAGNNSSLHMRSQGAFVVEAERDFDLYTDQRFDVNAKEGCELSTEGNIHFASQKSTSLSSGDSVAVRATRELVLACGKAKIILTSDGRIVLDGTNISTVASGSVTTNSHADIKQIARGSFTIKGSKVDIN